MSRGLNFLKHLAEKDNQAPTQAPADIGKRCSPSKKLWKNNVLS